MLHFGLTPSHWIAGQPPSLLSSTTLANLGLALPTAFTGYRSDFTTRSAKSIGTGYRRLVLASCVRQGAP